MSEGLNEETKISCLYRMYKQEIRIGFVPQQDQLFQQFTVEETLLFASRMNNANLSYDDHKDLVEMTMASLDLTEVKDSWVWKLSGGSSQANQYRL